MTVDVPAGVCGPRTDVVCSWVYHHTHGNTALARTADWVVGRPLAILGVLLAGWLATWLVRRIVARGINRLLVRAPSTGPAAPTPDDHTLDTVAADDEAAVPTREDARRTTRAHAVAVAVSSTLSALIWVIAVIAVLAIVGLDVEPIIAGAGLAGVAVAFGAQSLIKDLLNGIFILLEDHFGIGDEVQLGEATGVVEKMTLRETVLRDLDGTVWHVRNGEIDKVGNFSQVWSGALIDIAVVYDTDVPTARALLLEAAQQVSATPPFVDEVLSPPEILGVEKLDQDGITLRLLVKTLAGRQFSLQRALLGAINDSFAQHGLQFATRRRQLTEHAPEVNSDREPPIQHDGRDADRPG